MTRRSIRENYILPDEITKDKTKLRFRLQGVGNPRRDHPMRDPAPPIYAIYSHTGAFWEAGEK